VSPQVKICGINSREALAAAADADYVGFVFYPPSPRALTYTQAAALASAAPPKPRRVGLFVDASDETIAEAIKAARLDLLQLHGRETPERVSELRARFRRPTIKAISVAEAQDLNAVQPYLGAADQLLFDAKPPLRPGALPGGNAVTFDWRLLSGRSWPIPWMLSGGLTAANVVEAVQVSGARAVDVSSGVEDRPGHKDPTLIRAFLAAAQRL
jgi:phosphoribosylanthranilate isomerase